MIVKIKLKNRVYSKIKLLSKKIKELYDPCIINFQTALKLRIQGETK